MSVCQARRSWVRVGANFRLYRGSVVRLAEALTLNHDESLGCARLHNMQHCDKTDQVPKDELRRRFAEQGYRGGHI